MIDQIQYRTFGTTGRAVSEIGYGMRSLKATLETTTPRHSPRCIRGRPRMHLLDSAWSRRWVTSERLCLGELVRANPDKPLFATTKLPPLHRNWPSAAAICWQIRTRRRIYVSRR